MERYTLENGYTIQSGEAAAFPAAIREALEQVKAVLEGMPREFDQAEQERFEAAMDVVRSLRPPPPELVLRARQVVPKIPREEAAQMAADITRIASPLQHIIVTHDDDSVSLIIDMLEAVDEAAS